MGGDEEAAYHRAKMERPTEYAENTELQEAEIDAAGIKIHRIPGNILDREDAAGIKIPRF